MSFTFPVLTAIIFIPIVAAVIILFMNPKQRDLIRGTALSTALVLLALSAFVYFTYNSEVNRDGGLLDAQAQLRQMVAIWSVARCSKMGYGLKKNTLGSIA